MTTLRSQTYIVAAILSIGAGSHYPAHAGDGGGARLAFLEGPGGRIEFRLLIPEKGEAGAALVINGDEKIEVPQVAISGDNLQLSFPHLNSEITARRLDDGRLEGIWRKKLRDGTYSELPFRAEGTVEAKADGSDAPTAAAGDPRKLAGRWLVKFEKSSDPAIGLFKVNSSGKVTGTFITATGDYGHFHGNPTADGLRLSSFDGGRAMLVAAELQPDGTLSGDFWSRDKFRDKWTATRDETTELPDGFRMTTVKDGPIDLAALSFKDLNGKPKTLADFGGRVLLIDVFGSWCPNCHDASHFLSELHDQYAARGLAVVGLAFEYSGDFTEDSRQVRRFVERHKSKYPVLLGGVADKKVVAEALPFIEELKAYPTFIVIDRKDGSGNARVVATYAGFSGPATGEAHEELCRTLIDVVVRALGN